MADYDGNKQANQLNVVDSTITADSLILVQDVVGNPLGIAKPASIVSKATIDDIGEGIAYKKITDAEKTGYDDHVIDVDNPHSVTQTQVGLGNVDNTADVDKPVSTAQQIALNLKANINSPAFTGTVGGITKAMVGLGNADNTSDINKPISTTQQAAFNLKANLASPTFTGTVGGITKTMVGLSNVDNTADVDKPVSTAQQTALNLKANLASPALTGTPSAPTPTIGNDTTTLATTAFTQNEIEGLGFRGTAAIQLPPGTTAQRPGSPTNGMIRYNTDILSFEGYINGSWGSVGGGATGGVNNPAFYENDANVTVDYTITSGKNAMSAGPITIDSGAAVTIPIGSVWTIV